MEGKLVVYLKCTSCSQLFSTEKSFFTHCRSTHCEECVVFQPSSDEVKPQKPLSGGRERDVKAPQNDGAADRGTTIILIESEETDPGADLIPGTDAAEVPETEYAVQEGAGDYIVYTSEEPPGDDPHNEEIVENEITQSTIDFVHTGSIKQEITSDTPIDDPDLQQLHVDESMMSHQPTSPPKKMRDGVCSICNKYFKFLKEHMTYRHSDARDFVCDVCGHRCKQKGDLTAHLRVHTGEMPYECDICGKHFQQAGWRASHRRTHSDERPCLCNICGKSFRLQKDLKRHRVIHEERIHGCEICHMAFKDKRYLHSHMRSHMNDRRHVCGICGRGFILKANLKSHMAVHSKERAFACDGCGKTFRRDRNMKVHRARCPGFKPKPPEKPKEVPENTNTAITYEKALRKRKKPQERTSPISASPPVTSPRRRKIKEEGDSQAAKYPATGFNKPSILKRMPKVQLKHKKQSEKKNASSSG